MSWERYTESARRAVWEATEEAARLGQDAVATEHLLLALLRHEDTVACKLLNQSNVLPQTISAGLTPYLLESEPLESPIRQLSAEAEMAIDCAYEEARRLDCNYIGTEHLLLGLLSEPDGLAGRVLRQNGVTSHQIRTLWAAMRQAA